MFKGRLQAMSLSGEYVLSESNLPPIRHF